MPVKSSDLEERLSQHKADASDAYRVRRRAVIRQMSVTPSESGKSWSEGRQMPPTSGDAGERLSQG